MELGAGIDEVGGGLVFGGVGQLPGIYGSTASGAAFQNNEYFAGSGIVTVVPEPGAAVLLLLGGGVIFGLHRFRRRS